MITQQTLTRAEAMAMLNKMVTNESLRRHCLSVAFIMEQVAHAQNQDPEIFFISGLLHDADWEKYPDQHPKVIVRMLEDLGASDIAYAISCHGTEFGIPQKSLMDKSLIAIDELSGLVMALAKLKTDGLASVTPAAVIKKFKDPKFAAGVSRDEVKKGLGILGVQLEPWLEFIIASLQLNAEALGFTKVPTLRTTILPPITLSNGTVDISTKKTLRKMSDEELLRRQKRDQLMELGINPYPGDTFERDTLAKDIHSGQRLFDNSVRLAGRLMSIRDMGKSIFAHLLDSTGQVQLYFSNQLGDKFDLFKKYLDRGDIVGVEGTLFQTKTGELTVNVVSFVLITKALKPIPAVKNVQQADGLVQQYDGVTDPEFRYRRRYVDLIINPHIKQIFLKRTRIINEIRAFWDSFGWYEAQTPILQPIYGGASARPFVTHHNALDMPMYLRIANELYLKRLLIGGFDGVYEFSVDFRNEGMDKTHNPEFLQVELYVAFKDYVWMMNLVEQTVERVCLAINGTTEIEVWGYQVSFKRPWRRASMQELILEGTGIDIYQFDEEGLRNAIIQQNIPIEDIRTIIGKGKLIDELFGATVEKTLIQPTFVTDYPVELSPLAKRNPNDTLLTHRFEAYCVGKEFANAFSELNDPVDQRERFEIQLSLSQRGDNEAMNEIDEDFLRALEYGMPSAAGLGLGIDRLTMLLTDQTSIQEVILFPMMRPENF